MASGNIGLPFATAVRRSHELDVMVLETSSFQLETIRHFRPHVAVWLNLSPNHLDRYRDVEEYRTAKLRIFEEQSPGRTSPWSTPASPLPPLAARRITFSAYTDQADFTLRDGVIHLLPRFEPRARPIPDQASTASTTPKTSWPPSASATRSISNSTA